MTREDRASCLHRRRHGAAVETVGALIVLHGRHIGDGVHHARRWRLQRSATCDGATKSEVLQRRRSKR